MSYQSKHTGGAIDASVDTTQQILNLIYPIGAVYISVNDVNPANFIGGTWERIQDRFLVAAGSSYEAGTTGGTANHTHTTAAVALTVAQMPKHRHTPSNYNTAGSESGYKRVFTTHLDLNSDSIGRRAVGGTGSGYAITATTSNDLAGVGYTSYQGDGASHSHGDTDASNNLPPYLSVYMWKRTA